MELSSITYIFTKLMNSLQQPSQQTTPVASTVEQTTETGETLIDGRFYVEKSRWGTWNSYSSEGEPLVTGGTKEACIVGTQIHIYWHDLIDAGLHKDEGRYSGTVSGKL